MRVVFIVLALLLTPLVSALYADVDIVVRADGWTVIEGTTNVPGLVEESIQYTEKRGEHWLFNITTPTLDTFVYRVTLPEGAQVNYVSGKNARISTGGGHVEIQGSGQDAPLALTVQYTIGTQERSLAWIPLVAAVVLVAGLWTVLRARRPGTQRKTIAPKESATPTYIEGIPERQQAMIALLHKAGGTLTQRQIELALKLPKSSISRNVEALRRRGIIEKAQLGMTNTVVLAEKYR